jgi:hypothetical protein
LATSEIFARWIRDFHAQKLRQSVLDVVLAHGVQVRVDVDVLRSVNRQPGQLVQLLDCADASVVVASPERCLGNLPEHCARLLRSDRVLLGELVLANAHRLGDLRKGLAI